MEVDIIEGGSMVAIGKLKKELKHYDGITYIFLVVILGYYLILLIVARFPFGYVTFEAMRGTLFLKIINYSFLIGFLASFLFVVYPALKASFVRKKIYEAAAPHILEQYRLGGIAAIILLISAMALVFWLSDKYLVGQIIQIIIIDIIAFGIVLVAYALGNRGLDLPKNRRKAKN